MEKIDNTQLVVAGPLHNNEPTAIEVIEHLDQFRIPGVLPYRVPHEAPVGIRFLGHSELGAHFPGDRNSSDPEDRVAARMVADLQPVACGLLARSRYPRLAAQECQLYASTPTYQLRTARACTSHGP
jgi:hypothetical protein